MDATKPESVVNLTGNWSLVFWLSIAFLVLGVSLLARLITIGGDMRVAGMLAFSIACGYVYQGPPFRYAYCHQATFFGWCHMKTYRVRNTERRIWKNIALRKSIAVWMREGHAL